MLGFLGFSAVFGNVSWDGWRYFQAMVGKTGHRLESVSTVMGSFVSMGA
jgi:hypothetical protein